MSSPHCTSSPHDHCLAKTKAPGERTEEEWCLVSEDWEKRQRVEVQKEECQQRQDEAEKKAQKEAEHLVCKEAAKKVQEEAERKAEEEHKVQEEAARVKEEAERLAKEATAREEAAKRAAEAMEERLWESAGQQLEMAVAPPQVAKPSGRMTVAGPSTPAQRASGVQDPCTRCCNKGTLCILGTAKGKTTACEACCHAKVSCSWTKRVARETRKRKWVQQSEEMEDMEMVEVGKDEEEEVQSHFVVLLHLMEDHQDALGVLMTMLDKLSTNFLTFQQDLWDLGVALLRVMEAIADKLQRSNNLKEKEMGKSKEKAKEEFRRLRTDDDGDMEMGGAGPLSLA
ncbi:hypothetical protein ID866_11535 [Astraeus odoratus]|nr:hypothetical protein ID866_11535 [Astraeus odoratus]